MTKCVYQTVADNDAMPAASPAHWWHNKLAMTAMGHRQRREIPHIVDQRHGSETSMGNNLKICRTSSFEPDLFEHPCARFLDIVLLQ